MNQDFNKIYEETYKKIYVYVIARIRDLHDANDVLQIIYISLYKRICNKGSLPIEQALKILYTSAKHEIGRYYGFIKHQQKMIPIYSEEDTQKIVYELSVDKFIQTLNKENDKEMLEQIWNYIHEKDELTYRAFLLHYIEGLSFKECSNALSCSNAMIVHRIYRMIENLKIKFKEYG